MPNPEEFTKGLGDRVRGGLGVLGNGINTLAAIIQSGDRAVQTVDGALTGRSAAATAPSPPQAMTSEREVVDRVVSLVRQGNQEAHKTSDPKAPGVVSSFSEAIRTLFLFPLQPPSGISDLLPSPADMVKNGLRDLRGSMALVRVANGVGTFADVAEVASFAEDLIGRAQQVTMQPAPQPAVQVEPAAVAPAPVAAPAKKPRPPRKTKVKDSPKEEAPAVAQDAPPKKTASKTAAPRERKKKPSKADATFATTMAAELGDASIKKAAEEYRKGNLPDDQWVDKLTDKAVEMGVDFDALLARAETQVKNG